MSDQQNTAAAGGVATPTPGRPALAIVAALTVDLDGVRAKYECLLCQTREGPVYGHADVTAFTASIKADHRSRCLALQEPRP